MDIAKLLNIYVLSIEVKIKLRKKKLISLQNQGCKLAKPKILYGCENLILKISISNTFYSSYLWMRN